MIRIITLVGTVFLIGIIWSDLTFDSLGWETLRSGSVIAAHDLAQIESYYVRTLAMEGQFPLITIMMLVTVIGALWQTRQDLPRWLKIAGPLLTLPALLVSIIKTAPSAKAIAAGGISAADMSAHAHTLLTVHLSLLTVMTIYLAVQLAGFYAARK